MPAGAREPLPGLLIEHGSDSTRPLSAFLVGHHRRIVVAVGGQCDGYFSLPFVRPLANELSSVGWSLLLTRFGSSFIGSRDSHTDDATDLKQLVDLIGSKHNAVEVCLFGFDTGVQLVLEYLSSFKNTDLVTRVILHGAVASPTNETHCAAGALRRKAYIDKATAEQGGRAQLLPMPNVYDKDISVGRACGGYFSVQEAVWNPAVTGNAAALRAALAPVCTPLLVQILPGPKYNVPKEVREDIDHFVSSNAASTEVYVDFIDESADEKRDILSGSEEQHVASILGFLAAADKRRVQRVEEQRALEYEVNRKQRSILYNSELAYSK